MGQKQSSAQSYNSQREKLSVFALLVLSEIQDPPLPSDVIFEVVLRLSSLYDCSDVVRVAAGYYFSMALTSVGGVWAWGSNSEVRGQRRRVDM
jgi:alpha-tubulin suppressor-like RCC1 family protein